MSSLSLVGADVQLITRGKRLVWTVHTFLGPAGGWSAKEKIAGKVLVLDEFTPEHAQIMENRVCLHLRSDGEQNESFALNT